MGTARGGQGEAGSQAEGALPHIRGDDHDLNHNGNLKKNGSECEKHQRYKVFEVWVGVGEGEGGMKET